MRETMLIDVVHAAVARGAGGWAVEPGDFWCQVRPERGERPAQGWKLHLSATVLSAPLVLAAAAEVLVERGCAFKFAGTLERVRELGSRHVARGGGGKFITVYPACTGAELRALAEALDTATRGLPGPSIMSDRPLRPGSRVHYRFGAFSGVRRLGNDGVFEVMITAPDGEPRTDDRKAWFTPPPWAPPDPFRDPPPAGGPRKGRSVLLDDRYVVREVIRHAFTGGVYRATDRLTGDEVIVKQARAQTGGDLSGRDAQSVRRHESAMLHRFAAGGRSARPVALFEQQGDLFLVQEAIAGCTLREWTSRHSGYAEDGTCGPPVDQVHRLAAQLVDLVGMVHDEGLVLRDFNPNNVMVTDDLEARLIDLEMLAAPGDEVTPNHTPGYGAPEQIAAPAFGPAPAPSADLFGLGATLFHLVSGVDPLLPEDTPPVRTPRDRIRPWLDRLAAGGNEAAHRLAGIIADLMHGDPAARPSLAATRDRLTAAASPAVALSPLAGVTGPEPVPAVVRPLASLDDGLDHLVATMRPDATDRLWRRDSFAALTDPLNVQHGAAGILGVLTRAAEQDPGRRAAAAAVAAWMTRRLDRTQRILPGLHFGRSGTAWALLDAGRFLDDPGLTGLAAELALEVPVSWPNPDVCHGLSGAGLTQLWFWERTGDPVFLDRAAEAATAVTAAARHHDGGVDWPIPGDFPSELAGLTHHGFAHGTAGIAAFLLAAGRATGEPEHIALAVTAADTLCAAAETIGPAAYWTSGPASAVRKTHWCSGSSGIGTFLTQIWRETGADQYRHRAHQAAVAVHRSRWHAGTTQCHGLAGDAEFLLDLAGATGDETYRTWAGDLAEAIYLRHAVRDGRVVVPDETVSGVSPDYNTGLAGVLGLLLRLRRDTGRMWLPGAFTGRAAEAARLRVAG